MTPALLKSTWSCFFAQELFRSCFDSLQVSQVEAYIDALISRILFELTNRVFALRFVSRGDVDSRSMSEESPDRFLTNSCATTCNNDDLSRKVGNVWDIESRFRGKGFTDPGLECTHYDRGTAM